MAANWQGNRKKGLICVLLLCVLCGGAIARITFLFWQRARADADAKKITEARAQNRLDWIKEYVSLEAPPPRMNDQHPCVYQSMQSGTLGPRVGKCRTSSSLFSNPVDQFEVDLRYGAFVLRQTDLFLSDGFGVPFTRAYTSLDWFDPSPSQLHAFGKNTSHTYDIAPLGGKPLFSWLGIALEDGDLISFDRISRGENYSDGFYRHTETNGRFYKAVIYWNGGGWTTKLADGSLILFPDSAGAKKTADGAPVEIDDAAGNKLHLVRGADHNLQEVQTPHGYSIRLTYNDQGWITRAEDDHGNWVKYFYNSDGMLVTAAHSSGKKRRYEYDGFDLTVVRDEEDNILVQNAYEQGRIVAQQFADGQVYQYSYQWSPNSPYTNSATVRFPDGTQQTIQTRSSVPDYVLHLKE